jgi:nucleoside phosphorylase
MIHFICALKCEALPIINHYRLKHLQKARLFKILINDNHTVSLTITGIGKLAAAAATTYSYTALQCEQNDVWINLGVAGHVSHNIGDIYIANRVEDASSARVWFPQIMIDTKIQTAGLLTLDQPSNDYNDLMFDMEAAGFIFSAYRFATPELTQCIKIISDNQNSPAEQLSAKMTTDLISATVEDIVEFVSQLDSISPETGPDID